MILLVGQCYKLDKIWQGKDFLLIFKKLDNLMKNHSIELSPH
jgi:hypothetical protein